MAQGPDEVVRSQIAQTRTDIGDTLDAIQTRLSPSRVMSDVRESVVDATMGRAGMPAALLIMAASGAACWLLWRAWAGRVKPDLAP